MRRYLETLPGRRTLSHLGLFGISSVEEVVLELIGRPLREHAWLARGVTMAKAFLDICEISALIP